MAASPSFGSGEWWTVNPSDPPTQEFWDSWQAAMGRECSRLAGLLAEGDLELADWTEQFFTLVQDGHGLGYMLGRQRAGDLTAWSEADATTGIIASQFDASYLINWRRQIESGDDRYIVDGVYDRETIAQRMNLYVQRMRGTAGWGWEQSLPEGHPIKWVMTKLENCEECPVMAAHDWIQGELPFVPGEFRTPCMGNCGCHLEADAVEDAF